MNTPSRRLLYLALIAAYVLVHGRSLGWGWVGMDDSLLLERNAHLGHSWSSFVWGWTDVQFGRRWLPGVWTLANVFSGAGAAGFRLGSFVLGGLLVASVYRLLEERTETVGAFVAALLFAVNPMRCEVFGWGIGFVYSATALLCVWSIFFQLRGRPNLAMTFSILALVMYPQAAGVVCLLAYLNRGNWRVFPLWASLAYLFAVNMWLRTTIGYVPMHLDFGTALSALPHYIGSLIFPVTTVPTVPPGWHWVGFVGVALGSAAFAVWPKRALVCALVSCPLILAGLTESFWFAGRYSLFLSVAVFYYLCPVFSTANARKLGIGLAAVLGVISSLHVGFRSLSQSLAVARFESSILYGYNDIRTVSIGHLPLLLRPAPAPVLGHQVFSVVEKP